MRPYIPSEHKQQGIRDNFLMSRNFFYISENKAGFSYRAFVICYIENNISRISHRRIIKSCIPAHNYNPNHLALSVAKCNPGSRKTVEHPLESCTSSFICFISMYVLKARILDLILKPAPPPPFCIPLLTEKVHFLYTFY